MKKAERIKCFSYNGMVIRKGIIIFGIPTFEEIEPLNNAASVFRTEDIKETIEIPDAKPDIEQINQLKVKLCLKEAWITPDKLSLFINAVAKQKIIYTSCESDQPVHTVDIDFPFSFRVGTGQLPPETDVFENIVLAPLDLGIKKISCRRLFKNIIVRTFFFQPST